jgi:Flp pilus assembly protein TadD/2-polyprenyl-3-methyl-5-hydroxy-6-metoxy-1,4-benzoquinol methylase
MNRKERRAAQKRGGPAISPMAATLAQAFRAHQAGHRSDAERMYRDVLAAEPRNAAALHLLGALMQQSGRGDEAISLIRQAVAIEPHNPDYLYNLGAILNSAGHSREATEPLSRAIALKPRYAEAHFELGSAFARAGQLDRAEKSLRHALELQPGNAAAMNNLGRVLRTMNRFDAAVEVWQRAVALQPNLAIAQLNIGMMRHEQGRLSDAEESLRRALAIDADHSEAAQMLAFVLIEQGRANDALKLVAPMFAKRDSADLRATFVRCLVSVREFLPDDVLKNLVRRAISEAWGRPAELAPPCAAILRARPPVGEAIRRVSSQWGKVPASQLLPTEAEITAAAQEPLLSAYLEATPNSNIEIERFLTGLRAALLDRARSGDEANGQLVDLCAALAQQCFLNGYVLSESEDETGRVQPMLAALGTATRNNEPVSAIRLAVFACYRPLHIVEGAALLLNRSWSDSIRALLRQQIEEPLEEAALYGELPVLTAIDDTAALQDSERNPSSRWVKVPSTLQPLSIQDYVRYNLPGVDVPPLAPVASPDILIAGCGSGLPAIEAALSYRDARIFAVDASAANLAHARRHAGTLNLGNIAFAQADLPNLASAGRSFDVIESGGLLDRLADPWAGWSTLIALLRPGGVMRIGLLSDTARRNVAAAQDFARQGNYQSDAEGIRLLRQNLLRLPPDHPAIPLSRNVDFFSTGTCRDLFFCPLDPRMTLTQVQGLLASGGLEVLGLETTHETRSEFAKRFPDAQARTDLAAWHAFERDHPEAFPAMYRLWLRKPHAADPETRDA